MSKPLQWHFEIIDKATGSGKAIARVFSDIERNSKAAASGVHEADHALGVVQKVGQAFEWVKEKAFEMGKEVLHAVGQRQTTTTAFEQLLGDAEKAKQVFEEAESFAGRTGVSMEHIANATKGFLRAGFKPDELNALFNTIGDVGAVGGDVEGFANALQQTALKGEFGTRQMRALNKAGVESKAIYEELGKLYGVTGEQAKQMVKRHMIDGKTGVAAIVNSVEKTISKGFLGSAVKKQSETLEAQMKRLKMLPERIFGQIDVKPISAAFENVLEVFDPAHGGAAIGDAVNGVMHAIFDQFAGPEGRKKLEGVRDAVVDIAKAFEVVAGGVAKAIAATASWYEKLKGAFEKSQETNRIINDPAARKAFLESNSRNFAIGKLQDESITPRERAYYTHVAAENGANFAKGTVEGVDSVAREDAIKSVEDLANVQVGTYKDAMEIHSPSAVMKRMGMMVAQGLSDGVEAGAPGVEDSIGTLAKTPSTAAGGIGHFAPAVSITIQVQGGDGHDFEDLAARVKEAAEEALASTLEKLAIEQGARA